MDITNVQFLMGFAGIICGAMLWYAVISNL